MPTNKPPLIRYAMLWLLLCSSAAIAIVSSGKTPLATTDDDPVIVFTTDQVRAERHEPNAATPRRMTLTIVNEGSAAGWVSPDGGETWVRVPAGPSSRTTTDIVFPGPVLLQREAGGENMSDVYMDLASN